ncbi:MAG: DUF1653 domain-containing protein [Streptomyces sp.]|nr:DUF1653 domain-containing protein [Streptomyces sp.]
MSDSRDEWPVAPGVYEHFSGHHYQVDGIGHLVHGDGTDEVVGAQVVVYHALFTSPNYGEQATWVREVANFTEDVVVDGRTVPRFRLVGGVPSAEETR